MANAPTGKLAFEFGGKRLPLLVLRSAAGYYLGTCEEYGPFSRESAEYWATTEQAEAALKSGIWTQRETP